MNPPVVLAPLGIIALLVASFVLFPDAREELVYAPALLGGAAAIYSAYYVAANIRLQVVRDAQSRAFEFVRIFNELEFSNASDFVYTMKQDELSPREVADKVRANEDLRWNVLTVLNLFEALAIAVKTEWADEEIAYAFFIWVLPSWVGKLSGYLRIEREEDPTLFAEVRQLAAAWGEGKSVRDGRPLPSSPTA